MDFLFEANLLLQAVVKLILDVANLGHQVLEPLFDRLVFLVLIAVCVTVDLAKQLRFLVIEC